MKFPCIVKGASLYIAAERSPFVSPALPSSHFDSKRAGLAPEPEPYDDLLASRDGDEVDVGAVMSRAPSSLSSSKLVSAYEEVPASIL